MTNSFDGVSRRGLVAAGAALSAGTLAAMAPTEAAAAPPSALDGPPRPQASPVASTIASPRRNYLVYRTIGEFDISVESSSAERQFGGRGVHSVGAQTSLWASVDVPAGVQIKDVEFYVTNTTGSTVYGALWLWTADSGYFSYQLASIPVPTSSSQQAVLVDVASENNGPYPTGTKLFLTIYTPVNATVQWNGARVGMLGGGALSLRRAPARAYDSRTETKFAAGETRTITIGEQVARAGTVGMFAQVAVLSPSSAGYIQVWPATDERPAAGELRHPATSATFSVTCPLPTSRKVKIYSQRAAHILVDLCGTVG